MYDGIEQSFTYFQHLAISNVAEDSRMCPSNEKDSNSRYDYINSQVTHLLKEMICINTFIRGVIKTTSCLFALYVKCETNNKYGFHSLRSHKYSEIALILLSILIATIN